MYSFQTLEIYNSKSLVSKAVLPKKKNKQTNNPLPKHFPHYQSGKKHMNYYYVYHVLY